MIRDVSEQHGRKLMAEAANEVALCRRELASGSLALPGVLEARVRGALVKLRSAMDWLEDTPSFDKAHKKLDEAGAFVHQTFGCHYQFDGGSYWITCPVELAHVRIGLSPAFVIGRMECSICGLDPLDPACHHISGRHYDGERCHRVITEIDEIIEISLVRRPRQPDARIQKISMSSADVAAVSGPNFRYGSPLPCNRCGNPCSGLKEPTLERPSGGQGGS